MEASSLYRIAQGLQTIEVRIEAAEDEAGHVVVLAGQNATYSSRLLTEQGAVAVKRFLTRLQDRAGRTVGSQSDQGGNAQSDPAGSPKSDRIVERHSKRHPNLSTQAVRETINELGEDWNEAVLDQELTRRSYTKVLGKHLRRGAWGGLVTTQQDGDACEICQELDEVAYGIRRALREKPLPRRECRNRNCRCSYLPVFQENDLASDIPRRTL
ncbi:MAG: hypothetical protein BRD41_03265 [Bacteroidetes bacterium QS_1_63_11]|nr:MAG: hypothetical protein BRD41_03265 [Bacteroidetes bacterium QS_1_63_11]